MNPNKALWEKGDFTRIAETMRESGSAFVNGLGITPGSPSEFVELFRNYYGPTMNAFDAALKEGRADDLARELTELFASQNTSTKGGCSIPPRSCA
jgi:hypothetical protein